MSKDRLEEVLSLIEEKAKTDEQKILAIYKKFPATSKAKRGGKHQVMFTGNIADKFGVKNYSSAFLQDLSPEKLDKLYKLLEK